MNESIIPGIVIGVIVAVAAGYVSHVLRKREMQDLWAEEERRRKSDRRRELYERELSIVNEAVQAIADEMPRVTWPVRATFESRAQLMKEVALRIAKARLQTFAVGDQELVERYAKLLALHLDWFELLDLDTGGAKEGKEKEFQELADQTELVASEVLRRIREFLEEV